MVKLINFYKPIAGHTEASEKHTDGQNLRIF